MLQFTVPQFIDVEDKIIGPITTRQFLIMLTGSIFIGIGYKLYDFSLFVVVGLAIFAVSGIFAFLKINGMPFHFFVLNFLQTLKKPGMRVWNKVLTRFDLEEKKVEVKKIIDVVPHKKFTTSRLTELSLVVDTQGAYKEGAEIKRYQNEIKQNNYGK